MERLWILRRMYANDCACNICLRYATSKEKFATTDTNIDDHVETKVQEVSSIDDTVEDGFRKRRWIQRPDIDPDADTVQLYRWNCKGYDLPGFGRQTVHAYFKTQQNPKPEASVSCDTCAWTMVNYLQNLESKSKLRDKEGTSE